MISKSTWIVAYKWSVGISVSNLICSHKSSIYLATPDTYVNKLTSVLQKAHIPLLILK